MKGRERPGNRTLWSIVVCVQDPQKRRAGKWFNHTMWFLLFTRCARILVGEISGLDYSIMSHSKSKGNACDWVVFQSKYLIWLRCLLMKQSRMYIIYITFSTRLNFAFQLCMFGKKYAKKAIKANYSTSEIMLFFSKTLACVSSTNLSKTGHLWWCNG